MQAMACGLTGQLKEAETLLLQCLQMGDSPWWKYLCSPGTGSFKVLLSLGSIYARQSKFQEAIEVFIKAAKIPPSAELAIEHLAALQELSTFSIESLLKSQDLFNWRNIIIIAQTYARMGKRKEVWECLDLLDELPAPDQQEYSNRMIGMVGNLLLNVKRQVSRHAPDHPIINHL